MRRPEPRLNEPPRPRPRAVKEPDRLPLRGISEVRPRLVPDSLPASLDLYCDESERELLLLPMPDDEAGGGPLLVLERPPRETKVCVRERLGCDRCLRIVNSRLRLLLLPLLLNDEYDVAEESVVGEVSDEYMSDGVLSHLDESEDMAATAAPRRLFRFMGPDE